MSNFDIQFKSLSEIKMDNILELMNHPKIRQHMPLVKGIFDEEKYHSFIKEKEKMWEDYGFGPWAFTLNEIFIGWGGLQPCDNDVEIALVLHPKYFGNGKFLYSKIINYAFKEKKLDSVIILFPPTRTKIKGILKLGFIVEGKVIIEGEEFLRYRLKAPNL